MAELGSGVGRGLQTALERLLLSGGGEGHCWQVDDVGVEGRDVESDLCGERECE